MKISVITPSIRKEGLKIVRDSILTQSFKDWEWLICSPFDPKIKEAIWIPDNFKSGFWSLNRCYNALFKKVKSDLIVSLQDWIYIPPDGLEKFWVAHKQHPEAVISGVGDQHAEIDKWGKPMVKIWSDPRKRLDQGSFYECLWNDAEWNWCAIPKQAIIDVGGMDEKLDFLGYGGDQMQFSQRMNDLGVEFYLDQTNESFTIRHNRSDFGGEKKWNKNHVLFNGKYEKRVKELKNKGEWPKLLTF